jgi:hypothetical protein
MNETILSGCCRRDFIKNTALGAGVLAVNGTAAGTFGQEISGKTLSSDPGQGVQIPDVKIRMRHQDAFLVGMSPSEEIEITLRDVLKVHGYCAGGASLVFRQAQEAFRLLYGDALPPRQGLKVETAYHCCQAGAVSYITGAVTTYGAFASRGDLVLIPEETKKVVFTDKLTGKSVTILPLVDIHAATVPFFQKIRQDSSIAPQVRKFLNDVIQEHIYGPAEKLFKFA